MPKIKPMATQTFPLGMIGGTNFGRYPKISVEQTFNMIISDGFLVPYAGYKNIVTISNNGKGRGIFSSGRLGEMIVVIDNGVFTISPNFSYTKVGEMETFDGDVFIDENDNNQIALCDQSSIYIYNYVTNNFQKATLDFIPNYVSFQDGYFRASVQDQPLWRLSALGNGLSWPANPENIGGFQTKPDNTVAVVRMPSKGGLTLIFGDTVAEPWVNTGAQDFPYQRSSSYNIDYGCLNPATIATADKFIVWLAANEKSGPVIMISEGGSATPISNEGFNFRFSQLTNPENSYGFLFKQDGHLLYQLTFPSAEDNLSLVFDFNTQKFFTLTDPDMNAHIAKRVAFFNNSYYFVSFIDGALYELSTKYSNADGEEIPMIRICPTLRLPDTSRFVVNNVNFLIEQGTQGAVQRVDISISNNGGATFGNILGHQLNPLGQRRNKLDFWQLGAANEFTLQTRFWSQDRFVVGEGTSSIYQ